MDIVSYRGPGAAGGVSSGLGTIWRTNAKENSRWWFLSDGVIEILSPTSEKEKFIALLPESLVDGHYRFCNEFLWPIMHDLPQFASFSEDHFLHYKTFNRIFCEQIDVEAATGRNYFVQDYQLSLSSRWLSLFGHKVIMFWHIPWPKNVPEQYIDVMKEIVEGMLGAKAIGFHTHEYAHNFLNFVNTHLHNFKVDIQTLTVQNLQEHATKSERVLLQGAHKNYVMRHDNGIRKSRGPGATKLIVHPLGIDMEFWNDMRESSHALQVPPCLSELSDESFILAVDRVDYTKAVLERLLFIDRFFEENPEWAGSVTFAQVSGRSRKGIPQFDGYWHTCRAVAAAVNNRWGRYNWQPIRWITEPLNSAQLAYLYVRAQAMLVNPIRDGLNLTAKEFIACQTDHPGALLLSPGAGAWHELQDYALPVPPGDHTTTVHSIVRSLNMSLRERQLRAIRLKTILATNQLQDWWSEFNQVVHIPDIYLVGKQQITRRPANLG